MSAVTHTRADERLSRGLAYALALGVLGLYTALRGDMAAGLEMLETSIARHRHGGDQRVLADLLFIYADISRPYTDANVSSDLLNKVVALYQSINDPSGLPFAALVVLYGAQRHPDHRGLSHGRLTLNMDSRIIFLF
jgi:hypothetical protein